MIETEKIYTCKYDRVFKEIFAKEENKDILIKLLESILKVKIEKVEYLNLERSDFMNNHEKNNEVNKSNINCLTTVFPILLKNHVK